MSIVRTELRLLRHDPVPAAVLVGMPLVLMTLLSDAMQSTLAAEGYPGAPGSAQTVPGHGVRVRVVRDRGRRLRDLPRARLAHLAAAARGRALGPRAARRQARACRPLLVAAQHVVLFGFGVAFLDLRGRGSWPAVALIARGVRARSC